MKEGASLAFPLALLCLAAGAGPAAASDPDPAVTPTPTAADCGLQGDGIPATDVAIVLDTSSSTREPSGTDIDQDGQVGEFRRSEYTDPGDSLLAAEISAVRRFVRAASGDGARFAIVSFSGRRDRSRQPSAAQSVNPRDAQLQSELTGDVAALETALTRVLERGSHGTTSFAPAMRLALRSLERATSSALAARRRVLFLSDSSTAGETDRRMEIEAKRAIDAGIAIHSFGFGTAADTEPPHALAEIAGATGGTYHAVRDPTILHCALLAALRDAQR